MTDPPSGGGWTDDGFLDGRLRLRQPRSGYRIAIDTLLLAAAADPGPGAHVIDVGAGVGGVALAVAARHADARIVALEQDPLLAAALAANARANGLDARVAVAVGDLARPPLRPGLADLVLTNPPYGTAGGGTPPSSGLGRRARVEAELDLAGWLDACIRLLRPGGDLIVVHRADRLAALLGVFTGNVAVLPLWPKAGAPARRVLVRVRPGRGGKTALLAGLALHDAEGHFTPEADAILRGHASLSWE